MLGHRKRHGAGSVTVPVNWESVNVVNTSVLKREIENRQTVYSKFLRGGSDSCPCSLMSIVSTNFHEV